MNILEFKKGDKIVRVEPSRSLGVIYNPFTGQIEQRGGDRSYIGEKLTFIGVANGCAYFDREKDSLISEVTGSTKLDIRLDLFSDGWDYWKDPNEIGNESNSDSTRLKLTLKEELERELADENYELIAELKEIFDRVLSKD